MDGIHRLPLAAPLELETVVVRLHASEGVRPGSLVLHGSGKPSESLPALLGHTRGHEGSRDGNTSSRGVMSFAALARRTVSAMQSHCALKEHVPVVL